MSSELDRRGVYRNNINVSSGNRYINRNNNTSNILKSIDDNSCSSSTISGKYSKQVSFQPLNNIEDSLLDLKRRLKVKVIESTNIMMEILKQKCFKKLVICYTFPIQKLINVNNNSNLG